MKVTKIRVSALVVAILVVIGLIVWTIASPPILGVQSEVQLENSLFSYSKSFATQNFTDSSGIYTFKFGLDYSANVSQGEHVQLAVYCALTYEQITSFFTRGVGLVLQSASLSIDGRQDSGVKTSSRFQPGLQIFYIQNLNTNIATGLHNMTARLVVSNVDVNYVGNSLASTQVVLLGGALNITT
ncbi:MAG: hypothetical protein ACRECH_01415 [Nitrososphaerales archaeon]